MAIVPLHTEAQKRLLNLVNDTPIIPPKQPDPEDPFEESGPNILQKGWQGVQRGLGAVGQFVEEDIERGGPVGDAAQFFGAGIAGLDAVTEFATRGIQHLDPTRLDPGARARFEQEEPQTSLQTPFVSREELTKSFQERPVGEQLVLGGLIAPEAAAFTASKLRSAGTAITNAPIVRATQKAAAASVEDIPPDELVRLGGGITNEPNLTSRVRQYSQAVEDAETPGQRESAERLLAKAQQDLDDSKDAALQRGRQAAGGRSATVEAASQSFERRTGDSFDSLVDDQPPGQRYVAPLRPLDEVASEVVTSDNPLVRGAIGRSGINPSLLMNTDIGRTIIAHHRQRAAAEDLVESALIAANDSHFRRVTGSTKEILPIDDRGIWKGLDQHWTDVFSRSKNLPSKQQAYVNDLLKLVREVEELRIEAGLKPLGVNREGWFYFPRKVKGVKDIEFRRPSSPHLQRVFDDAIEGVNRGVNYENNPRAVLEIHLKQAYREILNKQLSDTLEPMSLTPKELLSKMRPSVVKLYDDSVAEAVRVAKQVRGLQRQMRGLQVGAEADAPQAAQELRSARGPRREGLQKEINDLKTQLKDATSNRNQARARYSAELERVRKSEVAPGNLFGPNQPDRIPIALWRNRFFPRAQADQLREGIETVFQDRPGNILSRMVGRVGDYTRFLASVGDFALPLTHGLPTLARRPDVWASGALRHYVAFLDPTVQSNYIRKHLATAQKLAQHQALGSQNEFFIAATPGRGPNLTPIFKRIPKGDKLQGLLQAGGKQTFGRFQAAYDTGLTSFRIGLWEALAPNWKGSEAELAQYIRNMTGGLDSRALGVGPSQRGFESMWMAFSPRLLRSTVSLMGAAVLRPHTPVGRESLRTLAQLSASVVGLYVLTGMGLGKSTEEIKEGLNPLNGKKFLSHQINGDWIGVGGQIRSITQALSAVASSAAPGGEPVENLWATDFQDNPIVNFYMSRGAPALNIAGAVGEGVTDANFLPYDQVDTPVDVFKHIGTSALPFTLQGILEGEQGLTSLAALSGARTSPETFSEARERLTMEQYQREFGNLPPRAQDQITQQVESERGESVANLPRDLPETEEAISAAFEAVEKKRGEVADHVGRVFDAGRLGKPLREAIQDGRRSIFEVSQSHFTDEVRAGLAERGEQTDLEQLREAYWGAPLDELPDGTLNFSARDSLREQVLAEAQRLGIPPVDITERRAITDDPVVQGLFDRYDQDIETLQFYWDGSNDYVWSQLIPEQRPVWDSYNRATDIQKRRMERDNSWLLPQSRFRDAVREQARVNNPEIDVALVRWGYVTRPLTPEGAEMLTFMQSP